MTVTVGFNLSQFTTDTINSYFVNISTSDGQKLLTLNTTNTFEETKTLNIFRDVNDDPKINVNGNVYNFQNDVNISLFSDLAPLSMIVASANGQSCALRLTSENAGEPRVIFSGATNGTISNSAKVAFLTDAFNVFNEATASIPYAGTFIFELPSLNNTADCNIRGGLTDNIFNFSITRNDETSFSISLENKTNPVVDGSFTFNKVLTIDYQDGTPALVYDVTDNFKLLFSQLSGLTAVNDSEYTYDVANAVSSSIIDGSFDGFRIELYTADDALTIGASSWVSNPYDAIVDFGNLSRKAKSAPAKKSRMTGRRIKEFDSLSSDLEKAKIRASILKTYKL